MHPLRSSPPRVPLSDRVRVVVVAVSAVLALIGSFIGSGVAGGTPIQDAAGGALAADATLIAPGAQAFGIWSVIYLGLVGYAVWQALPAHHHDRRQRMVGYPVAVSMVLNGAWILSIQAGLLWASVPIIVALLADLAWIFLQLQRQHGESLVEAALVDGTMGLYVGWVCVATAANVTAGLVAAGFDGFGIAPPVWAVGVVTVAGMAGIGLAVRGRGRIAPTLALGWGLTWVAVARLAGEPTSTSTAVAALIAVAAVVGATLVLRLRRSGSLPDTAAASNSSS